APRSSPTECYELSRVLLIAVRDIGCRREMPYLARSKFLVDLPADVIECFARSLTARCRDVFDCRLPRPPCFAVFDDAPAIRLTPPKLLPDNDTIARLRWDVRPRCLAVRTDENGRVRDDAAVANTRCREPLAERSPHLVLGLRYADAGVGATFGFGWL